MVGEMEGWPLDPFLRALLPYYDQDVVVIFDGFEARVFVDDLGYPDETESGWGYWLVKVRDVIHDAGNTRYSGAEILILSLDPREDTPERVTTLEGETIWQREPESSG